MPKIIFPIFILIMSWSYPALSNDFDGWSINETKVGNYQLVKNGHEFLLETGNVKAKLKEVKKFKNLSIIIFHQSTNGTSLILDQYDGVVFDRESKSFIGQYPYKHLPITKYEKGTLPSCPKWSYHKDHLQIVDEDVDINKKILIKN